MVPLVEWLHWSWPWWLEVLPPSLSLSLCLSLPTRPCCEDAAALAPDADMKAKANAGAEVLSRPWHSSLLWLPAAPSAADAVRA